MLCYVRIKSLTRKLSSVTKSTKKVLKNNLIWNNLLQIKAFWINTDQIMQGLCISIYATQSIFHMIKIFAHIYMYIYMLAIAGQATKPNWRIFFRKSRGVHGYRIKNIFFLIPRATLGTSVWNYIKLFKFDMSEDF